MLARRARIEAHGAGDEAIMCGTCGWTGTRDGLVGVERDLDAYNFMHEVIYDVMRTRPPTQRMDYHCPYCGCLMASHLNFFAMTSQGAFALDRR